MKWLRAKWHDDLRFRLLVRLAGPSTVVINAIVHGRCMPNGYGGAIFHGVLAQPCQCGEGQLGDLRFSETDEKVGIEA